MQTPEKVVEGVDREGSGIWEILGLSIEGTPASETGANSS